MNIIDIKELNERIESSPAEYIGECCDSYNEVCTVIAETIAGTASERPIILLAGPSGSGKTTSALKIEAVLDKMGMETHTISMDNYFLPKHLVQVFDKNNQIDFESPLRIDIPLLQEHMIKIANCEPVDVPYFDFVTQDRAGSRKLCRKKGELVLFEGIHALNPEVTGSEDIANCIYVSVRTRIKLADGQLVHPKLIRLMRRIIRDRNYRNRCPAETLDMFESVQNGEDLYINPYKVRSHFDVDTFHGFEPALYKPLLEDDIRALRETYEPFEEFLPISDLLNESLTVSEELVPPAALSREFIGGSCFEY